MIQQIELADATDDPDERTARCTFVVAGGGYTGTELAAHGKLLTDAILGKHPRLAGLAPHWVLLDVAARVLPELDERPDWILDAILDRQAVQLGLVPPSAVPLGTDSPHRAH